jgi:hypothetical protein
MNALATTLLAQMGQPQPPPGIGSSIAGLFMLLVELAILVVVFAGFWKMFVKAGQPGWGVLIPFYNLYLMLKVAGRPGWWFILLIIPVVGFVVGIVVAIDIARNFGKGIGFALGLIFLGVIFYPILGFGNARYQPVAH